jgi:cyclase
MPVLADMPFVNQPPHCAGGIHARHERSGREMEINRQLPESKHFRLQQLAEGVYAAIHIDGGAAIGNAGIVDLGDRTLVYDTFMAPQAAVDLRTAAEALTGRSVDAVIDSHWHNDHIWGNQVFSADTDIVATGETRRQFIATRGHGAYDAFMAEAEKNLEATRAQFLAAEEEGERRQLALWIDYHQSVVETKPILQIRAPNLTFEHLLAFHGTGRSAELIAFEGGHTESDTILHLPQEGIIFMSDLLFIGHQPYLGGGDPESLLRILFDVSALAPKLLVPGHGPVGSADSLTMMGQYVRTLDGLARKLVEEGEAEQTIDAMTMPEPFDDWLFASFFPGNMHFLHQQRLRERGDIVA